METIQAKPSEINTSRSCPLCAEPLNPAHPEGCEKCDWVSTSTVATRSDPFRDRVAVALSVVPGLGHIYKGHRLTGALYMLGAAFAIFAAVVASTATAGFGILLLPLYWLGVMLQVYFLEDLAGKLPRRR